ncbi:Spy/CpxP family protein refolding chaperone [Vaginella massiliensis]|uniref:Spy/CpxP family protein refolding chaperone n=1 Tax=Vaginella massiliensis TaxID=1816680 RepID=UPI000839943D|nr:Spy/CpxP family protein refolding chaperone [Vaginella massiliensis]
MKKIITLVAIAMALSVSAQTERAHRQDINPRMTQEQFMQKFDGLDIDEQQRQKLVELYQKKQAEREDFRKNRAEMSKNQVFDAKAAERKTKIEAKKSNEIQEILTPTQYEIFCRKSR